MKTAISVDDDLLASADETAKAMGVSRSRLFSIALESYLRERENERITEQLNRVYRADGGPAAREEQRTVANIKEKFRKAIKDRW